MARRRCSSDRLELFTRKETQRRMTGTKAADEAIPRRNSYDHSDKDMARLHLVTGENRRLSHAIEVISRNQKTTRRERDSEIRLLRDEFVQRQGELLADDLEKVSVNPERRSSQLPKKHAKRRVTLPNLLNDAGGLAREPTVIGVDMDKMQASIGLQVERYSRRRGSVGPRTDTGALRRCSTAPGLDNLPGSRSPSSENSDDAYNRRFGEVHMTGHISHKVNPGRKHSLAIVSREQIRNIQLEENRRVQREATFDDRFHLLLNCLQPK